MNIIYHPIYNWMRELNLEYYLEKYFNIAYINNPRFILILWLKPYPDSLVLESFLEPSPQSPKPPQPKSRAKHTDLTFVFAY